MGKCRSTAQLSSVSFTDIRFIKIIVRGRSSAESPQSSRRTEVFPPFGRFGTAAVKIRRQGALRIGMKRTLSAEGDCTEDRSAGRKESGSRRAYCTPRSLCHFRRSGLRYSLLISVSSPNAPSSTYPTRFGRVTDRRDGQSANAYASIFSGVPRNTTFFRAVQPRKDIQLTVFTDFPMVTDSREVQSPNT